MIERFRHSPPFILLATLAVTAVLAQPADSTMTVSEHGFGAGVEDRSLVGRGDTFDEGDTVWFWTRVVGGSASDRIRHVWFRDGEEVVSVGLSIGGSHWRTWSRKVMYPGSAGPWKVEVRDGEDRVIASAEFTCVKSD